MEQNVDNLYNRWAYIAVFGPAYSYCYVLIHRPPLDFQLLKSRLRYNIYYVPISISLSILSYNIVCIDNTLYHPFIYISIYIFLKVWSS